MATAQKIYDGRDFYVPHFEVRIDGRDVKKDVLRDVTQVSYQDSMDQIDNFQITVFNEWLHESM